MEKIKKTFKFIKEVYQDKKKRAIASLFLWLIFFIVLFLMLGNPRTLYNNYNKQIEKLDEDTIVLSDSSLENFQNMENYEFSYLIEITENNIPTKYKLDGTYYGDKYYFEINGVDYYINGDNIYIVDSTLRTLKLVNINDVNNIFNKIDIKLILKDSIYTFINSSKEENSTKYKDGNISRNYLYTNYNNKIININTIEYKNLINTVNIDFTNYFDKKYQKYSVNIILKNINNISEYNINYDEYKILEEGV